MDRARSALYSLAAALLSLARPTRCGRRHTHMQILPFQLKRQRLRAQRDTLSHTMRHLTSLLVMLPLCTQFSLRHKTLLATRLNPLNPELNPICYLLALLAHHFLHVSRMRVKSLTLRLLMSYIYGAPILDVSRSHTTAHHSR